MVIRSIEKAIEVLDSFSPEHPVLSVSGISKRTKLTKSTVSRILSTLEKKGCVVKDRQRGHYRLGPKLYQWVYLINNCSESNLPAIARPLMEKLRDFCKEEVSLYIREGNSRICVARAESKYGVARVTSVGTSLPLHCGAAGKVLLAYLREEEIDQLIREKPLVRYTPQTITDPDKLKHNLQQIRKDGYAISFSEREMGAFSIVAPIRDGHKKVVASLTISGPNYRFPEQNLDKVLANLMATAKEISTYLGFGG